METKPILQWREEKCSEGTRWNAYYNGFQVAFIAAQISDPETVGLPPGKKFYCVFLDRPFRQFPESLETGKEWVETFFRGFTARAVWEAAPEDVVRFNPHLHTSAAELDRCMRKAQEIIRRGDTAKIPNEK